jgi:hypothetical protein
VRKLAALAVVIACWLLAAGAAWGNTLSVSCGTPSGQCDESGDWQAGPTPVTWEATPLPNSVVGCVSTTYTDVDTTVSCQVWWGSSTQSISFPLKVETSPPTATATPARSPDSAGWYNHPLAISFQGSSFSGIASCTAITYAGPASPSATVTGSCTDNAGKTVTVTSAPFAYDATPPSLTATATPGDQTVALNWQTTGDIAPVATVQVTRSGGPGAAGAVPVYSGTATGFNDTHLRNGVHYTYTITVRDAAGNVTVQTIGATPAARLLSPSNNARVTAPPLLSWTAVSGATYYNVQLYRDDPTKLLSMWPTGASLRLRRAWRFDGRRYRLKPGRYRWYVWPGFGKRKAARYGHRIGTGTFVVVP